MHYIDCNKDETVNTQDKKRLVVKYKQIGAYEYVCFPSCELSFLACRLVCQDHLTGTQVKILELMGFEILATNEINKNNFYGD